MNRRATRLAAAGFGLVLLGASVWLQRHVYPVYPFVCLLAAWVTALPWVWGGSDDGKRQG